MLFTGQFEHSIDAKQRLAIPAQIRSRMDAEVHGTGFYLILGGNNAIWVWPERTFEIMAGDLEPSIMPATEQMEFDEVTFPEAYHTEVDSNGRIRLPEDLLADARIGSKVVILGVRNHLELRDPEEWKQRRTAHAQRRPEIVQRARAVRSTRAGGKEDRP